MKPLLAFRRRRKLSQAQAAKLLGVPVRTLQHWEQGRQRPSVWRWREVKERMAAA